MDESTTPPPAVPGRTRYAYLVTTGTIADGTNRALPIAFHYLEDDPFAVVVTFGDGGVRWTIARAVLTDAVAYLKDAETMDFTASRVGDDGETLALTVAATRRPQTWHVPTEAVREFLRMTHALVPLGHESEAVDWTEAETVLGLAPGALTGTAE